MSLMYIPATGGGLGEIGSTFGCIRPISSSNKLKMEILIYITFQMIINLPKLYFSLLISLVPSSPHDQSQLISGHTARLLDPLQSTGPTHLNGV